MTANNAAHLDRLKAEREAAFRAFQLADSGDAKDEAAAVFNAAHDRFEAARKELTK